jgi:hypothetical protein
MGPGPSKNTTRRRELEEVQEKGGWMNDGVTMTLGATYEVLDVHHPCTLWRGRLTAADFTENWCCLDFGHEISGVFKFGDTRLSLVGYPEVEEEE